MKHQDWQLKLTCDWSNTCIGVYLATTAPSPSQYATQTLAPNVQDGSVCIASIFWLYFFIVQGSGDSWSIFIYSRGIDLDRHMGQNFWFDYFECFWRQRTQRLKHDKLPSLDLFSWQRGHVHTHLSGLAHTQQPITSLSNRHYIYVSDLKTVMTLMQFSGIAPSNINLSGGPISRREALLHTVTPLIDLPRNPFSTL